MKVDRKWLLDHRSKLGGWSYPQLAALGVEWPPQRGWINRVTQTKLTEEQIKRFLGIGEFPVSKQVRKQIKREAKRIRRRAAKQKRLVKADSFLESYEWRKVRMQVLIRDGARCCCCGATRHDGRRLNVDHIKPRKLFPQLALDPKNLQVLCDVCNHGKGNWDQTDWRDEYSEAALGAKLRLVK